MPFLHEMRKRKEKKKRERERQREREREREREKTERRERREKRDREERAYVRYPSFTVRRAASTGVTGKKRSAVSETKGERNTITQDELLRRRRETNTKRR